ncbi:hypothetical protein KAFR_0B04580 [Kazachstania africana CBS 2517]|uniref:C2H2-type domain-containing protein n=1 Tax=Kazachstania africana (strain ATCC 22294 / BCRC 22015 / CBS 2517 / CECT 1963 / NBRC 1671 / NRRL Y-8276) TaxID=1071382 RepID=H2AQV5_KAZAF|nr:hypothetical protein KAFR_0B04580 [Kazachstania africana CBS 2517]CCF56755.1 hypothetical protein KAFR_0B04580 [Kazachstania africana CBS 2517]
MSEKMMPARKETQSNNQSQTRPDSISAFTNFNQPRFSTDPSVSTFLNIAENQNSINQNNGDSTVTTNPNTFMMLSENGQIPQQGNLPDPTQNTDKNFPDLAQLSRGFSIVNNIWSQQPQTSSQQSQPSNQQQYISSVQNRNGSNNHVVFDPVDDSSLQKNKRFSFSLNKLNQYQFAPRNDSLSNPLYSSKRNSLLYTPNEVGEFDFLNISSIPTSKRGSVLGSNMKPPSLLPPTSHSNNNNKNSTTSHNNSFSNVELETLFNNRNSRKNSLKFITDDFDFQNKRRNSSLRALIDPSATYTNSQPHSGFPQTLSRLSSYIGHSDQNDKKIDTITEEVISNPSLPKEESTDEPLLNEDIFDKRQTPKKTKTKRRSKGSEKTEAKKRKKSDEKSPVRSSSFDDIRKKINEHSHAEIPEEFPHDESVENRTRALLGVTKIDQLMLMIEARKKGITEKVETTKDGQLLIDKDSEILPPSNEIVGGVEKPFGSHGVKQHECRYCHRFFTQLTHLEVHIRSHIGIKPYQCQYCGKKFTQGGNLRTHERLHTGEKPYQCELCGKRFSRKGNLAAHVLTHKKIKPFICKLDNCNKSFTQLGNMKGHQNKFHLETLTRLTARLAQLDPKENISTEEREMLEYFASLYKNSNKGIKGRGRGSNSPSDHPGSFKMYPNEMNPQQFQDQMLQMQLQMNEQSQQTEGQNQSFSANNTSPNANAANNDMLDQSPVRFKTVNYKS